MKLTSLALSGLALVALSSCETLDGHLQVIGRLSLRDNHGVTHNLNSGESTINLSGKSFTITNPGTNEKIKVKVPSGFDPYSTNQRISAQSTGQNVDIAVRSASTTSDGVPSVSYHACDRGTLITTTYYSTTTTHYDIHFLDFSNQTLQATFVADTRSTSSYSTQSGDCWNRPVVVSPRPLPLPPRPFPLPPRPLPPIPNTRGGNCPPGTLYDSSIGRCVAR